MLGLFKKHFAVDLTGNPEKGISQPGDLLKRQNEKTGDRKI
jgi:hypothetical protein